MRSIFALIIGLIVPVLAQAQSDSLRSAPIFNVRYEVGIDSSSNAARSIPVVMSFDVKSTRPVLLSIPAWTPGSYEIRNFAKYVSRFGASEDSPLLWDKVDPDTWRVRPSTAGRVTVRYAVRADTMENASAWTHGDFAFFNGTNVFMYPEEAGYDFPASVALRIPPAWKVATGLGGSSVSRTFSSQNYHELVDHPFFVGKFDLDSMVIGAVQVRFASYPSQLSTARIHSIAWEQLRKMFPVEAAVFHDTPFQSYTVLQVIDSAFPGAAALEHENSQLVIMSPDFPGTLTLGSLYAHELFHAWNVKRLRPAEMFPYRYERAQPTTLLWVSEGITDYYADLALVRGGIATTDQFLFFTVAKLDEVLKADAVESLEDLSLSAWLSGTGGGGELYYPKGSLAGLLLDIEIREASGNRGSLDDVMRDLYDRTYKKGNGFTVDQWWAAVSRAAGGKSFAEFAARYVDGREAYPMDSVLRLAGFKLETTSIRIPRVGVSLQEDSVGSKVFAVERDGPADRAGIKAGDYIVSLGGISADSPDAVEQFGRKYQAAKEGTPISVDVRRAGTVLHFTAPLNFATRDLRQIVIDRAASAKAIVIREGLLHGTTQP